MSNRKSETHPKNIVLSCAVCGVLLKRKPSAVAKAIGKRVYCGRDHQALDRRTQEILSCAYCGSEVIRKPSRLARNKSGLVFCSREHQGLAFRTHSGIPASSGPENRSGREYGKATTPCAKCGNMRTPSRLTDDLCSKCHRIQGRIQQWLTGDLSVTYIGRFKEPAKWVKRHLIETRGDKCEVCKISIRRADGTSVIQMNHIDGDYLNNRIENLELLCPNHHAVTETWGSRNQSMGRRKIAQRIEAGLES